MMMASSHVINVSLRGGHGGGRVCDKCPTECNACDVRVDKAVHIDGYILCKDCWQYYPLCLASSCIINVMARDYFLGDVRLPHELPELNLWSEKGRAWRENVGRN